MVLKTVIAAAALAIMFVIAGCEDENSGPVTKEQVETDVNKVVHTTGQYIAQEQRTAVAKAKEEYAEWQSRTQAYLSDLQAKSQAKWEEEKPEIDAKMEKAQQKLNDMGQAMGDAFDAAKREFYEAVQDVNEAFQKAKK
jgi:hypothetical protein